ncbi:MAG: Pr2TM family membrane protein [Winogradskyella sp.]|nr:dihydrofolate reductase [Winogradskyella sp.]NNK39984.1 Pr2TM family membrane protein [Winogradskyella sp.]
MFGKKKTVSQIDKEQLELIKTAQKRIRQKKRLYIHFVIFLIGAVFLILANTVLGIGKDFQIFKIDWFVFAIGLWLFFFIYHLFNVFVTHKFMGKDWEEKQLAKLVNQQKDKIEELKTTYLKDAQSDVISKANKDLVTQVKQNKKTDSEITIIVAAGEDNAIGKNNELIWHLSDDLKRFKSLTEGHHIIMGRKTFESFPKPLPKRTHIVISRQEGYKVPDDVIVVNSIEDALDAANKDKSPYIIGGGEIYRQAMDIATKIELTRVHATFENADTFFPEIDPQLWKVVKKVPHDTDENHKYAFTFYTYERI